ncbi:apoptosis-associated speck-like protein containing a CARD isoform X3 [Amia ocellicauda]|uniref:apoptosis-associated speck-like protein containing a CARD isoform X3 n=1 Tax=Amia ocellicauda TaxID=2972642 RepID=UPI003463FAD5
MSKTTKDWIIDTLENLVDVDLKKFKSKLCDRPDEPKIRKGAIQKADYVDLADKLVSTYTENGAVNVTIEVLESIGLKQEAADLRNGTKTSSGGVGAPKPASGPGFMKDGEHVVDKHRAALIQRVSQVEPILDALLASKILNHEMYSKILAESTSQSKMRLLLSGPMVSCGIRGKDELWRILKKQEPYMTVDLEGE